MADVPVPSVVTVTPASADTVLGVKGGAVKRFTISALPFLSRLGSVPAGAYLTIKQDTPGGDNTIGALGREQMTLVIGGAGTYRVVRPNIADKGVNVGVFLES